MGRKIFVSYKYADSNVNNITGNWGCTVRDYVDKIEEILEGEHIYKGESDNEDLSKLSEETIWNKLKDRIYDSSMTIVLISAGMKKAFTSDIDQWIPWEISYSLKETSRKNKNGDAVTSKSNAMLAIVLPDLNNSYSYYVNSNKCCALGCRTLKTDTLFKILKENMFNIKIPNKKTCNTGSTIYYGECSYIETVLWKDFITNYNPYIDNAYVRRDDIDNYDIHKEV